MGFLIPRFYAILDAQQAGERSLPGLCDALLAAGVRLIQYRDKQAGSRDLFEVSRDLAGRVQRAGGVFIVNDRADVALAAGADGVHLGQEDLPVEMARRVLGPGKWLGYSTHRQEQVAEADRSSADYIAFGPVFATRSKARPDPLVGLEGLRQARRATRKPLVAIGGITLVNAREVIEAGADSVAVIADLLQAPDVAARAREFLTTLGEGPTGARD
jgi:thiamine-phosphate pyrophosphorylase